jgi:hypothetical protein
MYIPISQSMDIPEMTDEELVLAAQAAEDFANCRCQSEEY